MADARAQQDPQIWGGGIRVAQAACLAVLGSLATCRLDCPRTQRCTGLACRLAMVVFALEEQGGQDLVLSTRSEAVSAVKAPPPTPPTPPLPWRPPRSWISF